MTAPEGSLIPLGLMFFSLLIGLVVGFAIGQFA